MNSKWTFEADRHETGLNDEVEDLNEQTKERLVSTEGALIPATVYERSRKEDSNNSTSYRPTWTWDKPLFLPIVMTGLSAPAKAALFSVCLYLAHLCRRPRCQFVEV